MDNNKNGWNFYRNGKFQFTLGDIEESEARKNIAHYIQTNGLNPKENYTFQRFKNHDNSGFKRLKF